MQKQKETFGLNTGAKGVEYAKPRTPDDRPTLAEAGIDKRLANQARVADAAKKICSKKLWQRQKICRRERDGGRDHLSEVPVLRDGTPGPNTLAEVMPGPRWNRMPAPIASNAEARLLRFSLSDDLSSGLL
jgi:hypothetical protein